jgi:hypothetical protein
VAIPPLQDEDEWARFEAARRAMWGKFDNAKPASRYGIGASRSA